MLVYMFVLQIVRIVMTQQSLPGPLIRHLLQMQGTRGPTTGTAAITQPQNTNKDTQT